MFWQAGAKTKCKVSLGAWTWDCDYGEELRVGGGAGLAEPYNEAWCAVEYWESKGSILRMLLEYLSPNDLHNGRTLIFHAILCQNAAATKLLLAAGADAEHRIPTRDGHEFRPLHLAARLGCLSILKLLVTHGCKLDIQTHSGTTALMLCAKESFQDCFNYLLVSGADVGLLNQDGQSVMSIADLHGNGPTIHNSVWEALKAGQTVYSSNPKVFSSLRFVARLGDVETLQNLLKQGGGLVVNSQDKLGYSAAMIAAKEGHLEAFKLLVYAGADVGLKNSQSETALSLAKSTQTRDGLEHILVEAIMADISKGKEFKALHFASKRGEIEVMTHLIKRGSDINAQDDNDHTPLMLAAMEGHEEACRLLLLAGADTSISTSQGETALMLAKQTPNTTERVIMDHLAKKFVLGGSLLLKHTRQGKGTPHMKTVRMLRSGLLSWGDSSRRNVMCCDAALGPSLRFQRNRKKGDASQPGTLRVITNGGREVHFESSSAANAELWVRGIKLILLELGIRATLSMDRQ
jgi:ankyrin repeat protein